MPCEYPSIVAAPPPPPPLETLGAKVGMSVGAPGSGVGRGETKVVGAKEGYPVVGAKVGAPGRGVGPGVGDDFNFEIDRGILQVNKREVTKLILTN